MQSPSPSGKVRDPSTMECCFVRRPLAGDNCPEPKGRPLWDSSTRSSAPAKARSFESCMRLRKPSMPSKRTSLRSPTLNCAISPRSTRIGTRAVNPSTTSCPRPSPPFGRRPVEPWGSATTTSRSWVAPRFTSAILPRCARVRARPSWRPCPRISMHCPAMASTWSPSMTTWPSATRSGWAVSIASSGSRSASSCRT
ncbi:unannotated protein [freshwater metagenome]|uniref:Unannotated protein n=1 Tax=freshwater metagenome TaxID=449393 RepID=A0A6J7IMM1_9ZZZZ